MENELLTEIEERFECILETHDPRDDDPRMNKYSEDYYKGIYDAYKIVKEIHLREMNKNHL